MKFYRKFSYLPLLAAFSLMTLQAGQAFSDEAKPPQPKPEVTAKTSPTDPVAKVNGTVVTREQLERAINVMASQNRMGQPPAGVTKEGEEAVLDQLIAAELLYQAGSKLEMKELDKQVAEKIAQSKAKFPDNTAFETALKSASLTVKELEELVRKDIVINSLVDKEVAAKIAVSDADAKKFYDENIDKFKQGENIRASHILCGIDPKATAEEKKKAKEKAEALLKEIKAGKDFAELAKTNSTCPSSAQGGDLGEFGKGQMVPSFEAAAFALKPGEVSDVVETQFGYHIIKLTEKKEAGVTKFDEVKERIQEYLKGTKMQKAVADYIDNLKGKAKIEKLAR
jgi:peptidyl-prolyl cis-trans isomerase C